MTISPSEICSRCHKNSMNCQCDQFHPNLPGACITEHGTYEFTIEELRALYRLFEREYIPYEDEQIHAVTRKIMNIIKQHDA